MGLGFRVGVQGVGFGVWVLGIWAPIDLKPGLSHPNLGQDLRIAYIFSNPNAVGSKETGTRVS